MLSNKSIPLYYQLETLLRKKIESGDFTKDVPLPSEEALADEYNISRITVRQAMASLERDGLIVRQRGKGTFISANATIFKLPRYTGSIEDLVLMGKRTSTDVLESAWVAPPDHIRKCLRLGTSDQVFKVQKIRRIEISPFSHVFNYLPPFIGEKLPLDLIKSKPMLMILEDELGIRAVEAEQSVEATIADPQIASMLEIRVGDPLLKAERTVYDNKKNPIEYVSVLYRADKYAFTVKLKRKRTKESIGWGTD